MTGEPETENCVGMDKPTLVTVPDPATACHDESVPSVNSALPELPVCDGSSAFSASFAAVCPVPPCAMASVPVMPEVSGRPVALVSTAAEGVPSAGVTSVGEVAIRDSALFVDEDQDVAELLERPVFQRVGRAVVRAGDGGIGILSRTDVERALRAWEMRRNPTMRPHSAA